MGKPHIFLTGDRQVGKSFLLHRVLQDFHIPLSGFQTKWGETSACGADLYLKDAAGEPKAILAHRDAEGEKMTVFMDAFDTAGVIRLQNLEGLVLMDELGKFEAKSQMFSARVLEILDSDMPVFGVVRDKDDDFLNAVREHPKTQVIRVTRENRDAIYFEVREIVKDVLKEAGVLPA